MPSTIHGCEIEVTYTRLHVYVESYTHRSNNEKYNRLF